MSDIISVSSGSDAGIVRTVLRILKFIFVSYIISVILLALLALLLVYTDFPESYCAPAVKVISFLGAFVSALLSGRASGTKGLITGLVTGCANIAILLFIGLAFSNSPLLSASNFVLISGGALCGAAGGIIGVNLGKN